MAKELAELASPILEALTVPLEVIPLVADDADFNFADPSYIKRTLGVQLGTLKVKTCNYLLIYVTWVNIQHNI